VVTDRRASQYLDSIGRHFASVRKKAMNKKDSIEKSIGPKRLAWLKENYENEKLMEYLLDPFRPKKIIETSDRFIQKDMPVYMKPVARNGRAHFYAPYKMIGNLRIGTFGFNMAVLWLATLLLYAALYYNVLQKAITYFSNLKVMPQEK